MDVSGTEKSAFFQQLAVNAEAVSSDWSINAYALIPVGDKYAYGLNVGYLIILYVNASVDY